MKVLICDDTVAVQESVAIYLKKEGIYSESVCDGETALIKIKNQKYDLVVLDIMLPGIDGIEVCRKIRETSDMPILMLSAVSEEENRIMGLEFGADDYVTKPFSPKEVAVRIRNMLRRYKKVEDIIEIAELKIDIQRYEVFIYENKIEFTPKEIEILYYFMKNENRVLSREQILNSIWGYDYEGDVRAVDTHIKRIRKKLPQKDLHFFIRSIYGVGYKFEVIK